MNSGAVTMVSPVQIGQVVKVVDKSQFAHVVHIGAVQQVRWFAGQGLYAKVWKWSVWVPVDQCVPIRKREMQ